MIKIQTAQIDRLASLLLISSVANATQLIQENISEIEAAIDNQVDPDTAANYYYPDEILDATNFGIIVISVVTICFIIVLLNIYFISNEGDDGFGSVLSEENGLKDTSYQDYEYTNSKYFRSDGSNSIVDAKNFKFGQSIHGNESAYGSINEAQDTSVNLSYRGQIPLRKISEVVFYTMHDEEEKMINDCENDSPRDSNGLRTVNVSHERQGSNNTTEESLEILKSTTPLKEYHRSNSMKSPGLV